MEPTQRSPFPGRGLVQGGKGKMTDAGTRVAFVANWKGRIDGTKIDRLVSFADVLPTIGDVTSSRIPSGTDGQSLMPLFNGKLDQDRKWLFMSYSPKRIRVWPVPMLHPRPTMEALFDR